MVKISFKGTEGKLTKPSGGYVLVFAISAEGSWLFVIAGNSFYVIHLSFHTWTQKGVGGQLGPDPPGKSQKWLFVSLEILVRSNWNPSGPIASRGRSVQPSVKYVDDFKKGPP